MAFNDASPLLLFDVTPLLHVTTFVLYNVHDCHLLMVSDIIHYQQQNQNYANHRNVHHVLTLLLYTKN